MRLRKYAITDAAAFVALNTDVIARKHVGGPLTPEKAAAYLAHFVDDLSPEGLRAWAVESPEGGNYLGHAWLIATAPDGRPEVGVIIEPACWGRGFGSEAIVAIARYAVHSLGMAIVYATVDPDNRRSIATLRRAGFRMLRTQTDDAGEYHVYAFG